METLQIDQIIKRKPFNGLFQLEMGTIARIEESIKANGYDERFPVIVWKGDNVCIDGHQRLYALHTLGKKNVPVVYAEFKTEKEAIEYAVRIQRDRRNITDADILRRVEMLDERMTKAEAGSIGGKQSSTDLCLCDGETAEVTAKKAGTSPAKVKKARTILDHAPPEIKEAVETGQKTINQGYTETQAIRKKDAEYELSKNREFVKSEKFESAFNEFFEQITHEFNNQWRTTSREYAADCAKKIIGITGR